MQEADGGGEHKNPLLEGLYEVSRMIRKQAPDDASRDLCSIANRQLALHYRIAAFGTIRTYADQGGLSGKAQAMQTSLDEAKQSDEQHHVIDQQILTA